MLLRSLARTSGVAICREPGDEHTGSVGGRRWACCQRKRRAGQLTVTDDQAPTNTLAARTPIDAVSGIVVGSFAPPPRFDRPAAGRSIRAGDCERGRVPCQLPTRRWACHGNPHACVRIGANNNADHSDQRSHARCWMNWRWPTFT
jgi:hypothetical protein